MTKCCILITFIAAVFCMSLTNAAKTESFDVYTSIVSRFAETVITSRVRNEKKVSQKIGFQVLLPNEAFISGFSMTIDEITHEAIVEEKEEAEKTFRAAKARNKTAGLVATRKESRKTFKTSVNIAANATVEFRLVYQQLLRRIRGKFRHQLILLGSQLTDLLTIRVDICEKEEILSVDTPPILDSQGRNISVNTSIDLRGSSARIDYLQGQNEEAIEALSSSGGSFVVEYELAPTEKEGQIILNNGYFVYLYAPDIEIQPRRVVFTLDLSGSMGGTKVNQLKEAMRNIISKLTEDDLFTIVTFASEVQLWKNTMALHAATQQNIADAQQFIIGMGATGATNINEALITSLNILNNDVRDSTLVDERPSYIVFLTDGYPTTGETNPDIILKNVDLSNVNNTFPIHAIGFGSGVDANFLQSLAARSNGTWTQIFEDINAALQIQNYLDELSVPFLSDLQISYPTDIVDELIIHHPDSFLAGGELIALGRLKDTKGVGRGPYNITLSGGRRSGNISPINAQFFLDAEPLVCQGLGGKAIQDFGRKSFALSDVTETLRRYNAEFNDTIKERLKQDAINKSIEAGLVTPVTSLLVIKPEDRKEIEEELEENEKTTTIAPAAATATTTTTTTRLPRPRPTPRFNTATTIPWWQLQGDPHFVVQLSDSITACFNWMGKNGEFYNLLNDPNHGIAINGMMEGEEGGKPGSKHAIFITKLAVILRKEHIAITINAKEVVVKDTSNKGKRLRDLHLPMQNVNNYETTYGPVSFQISDVTLAHTILNISVSNDISFIVNIHHPSTDRTKDVDHLDLIISGSEKLSKNVGGLFGQFPRKSVRESEAFVSVETSGTRSFLWYRNLVTPVTKTLMTVPYLGRKVPCWFIAKPEEIIGSALTSFKVQGLFKVPKTHSSRS